MSARDGMSPADLAQMREAQQGLCYLCRDPLLPDESRLVAVDHDHRCCPAKKSCAYCRRGLTCHSCNLVIGHARDDPERLRKIADNLEAAIAVATRSIASKPSQAALFEEPGRVKALKRPRAARQQPRGALADVLKVFADTNGLHWPVIAKRLAAQFPDRWAEVTPGVISTQCRALGVPSVPVTVSGRSGRGCRKADLMTALTRKTPLAA